MAAQNYVLLERVELNTSAASVTFNNIPQSGYTDLKIVGSVRSAHGAVNGYMNIRFNGSSSNISLLNIEGAGSGTPGSTLYSGYLYTGVDGDTATANTFGNFEIYVPNYLSTTASKSISIDQVNESNTTAVFSMMAAGLWAKSPAEAINSITLSAVAGNLVSTTTFLQYSTFSIYGLAAVGTTPVIPKATGGDTVISDGTYWYHAFFSSGTFKANQALTCDVLQVAGGGGGGFRGGGGGAGGLLGYSSQSVTATSYTVTVGAGGTKGTSEYSNNGTNGGNSQFGALTASVGGGYGGAYQTSGNSGGSGGGGGATTNGTVMSGGSGTSGQGTAGANGSGTTNNTGGGGGGASVAGTTPNGGNGSSAYSSWGAATATGQNVSGTYYYAGGGGAGEVITGTPGTGGYGGGASAVQDSDGVNGTANTGGGASGGSYPATGGGGNGGSGIVIIRYPV